MRHMGHHSYHDETYEGITPTKMIHMGVSLLPWWDIWVHHSYHNETWGYHSYHDETYGRGYHSYQDKTYGSITPTKMRHMGYHSYHDETWGYRSYHETYGVSLLPWWDLWDITPTIMRQWYHSSHDETVVWPLTWWDICGITPPAADSNLRLQFLLSLHIKAGKLFLGKHQQPTICSQYNW